MIKVLIIAFLLVVIGGGWMVWKEQKKVTALETKLSLANADNEKLWATNAALVDKAKIDAAAAVVAQKERARVAVQAKKYETVRDAFRKGNFRENLPDDFKLLVSCLLWRAAGSPGAERVHCPGG